MTHEDGIARVIAMFDDLESILKSDTFMENLRIELRHSNPDYLAHLRKKKKDMEKLDHGIVIAGLIMFRIYTYISYIEFYTWL